MRALKVCTLHLQEAVLHVVKDPLLWRAFGMSTRRLDLACIAAYMRSTAAAADAALHQRAAVAEALMHIQEASLQLVSLESGGLQRVSFRPLAPPPSISGCHLPQETVQRR